MLTFIFTGSSVTRDNFSNNTIFLLIEVGEGVDFFVINPSTLFFYNTRFLLIGVGEEVDFFVIDPSTLLPYQRRLLCVNIDHRKRNWWNGFSNNLVEKIIAQYSSSAGARTQPNRSGLNLILFQTNLQTSYHPFKIDYVIPIFMHVDWTIQNLKKKKQYLWTC